jgi:hypothetical protein
MYFGGKSKDEEKKSGVISGVINLSPLTKTKIKSVHGNIQDMAGKAKNASIE